MMMMMIDDNNDDVILQETKTLDALMVTDRALARCLHCAYNTSDIPTH